MVLKITVITIILLAIAAAFAAWFNTHLILKDLEEIKDKLGIKSIYKASFLDRDLDNDQ
ncbi:hypothetical protein [Fictibacillus sp. BK138]|uniref:hypothetical protein n=1 Tax=Fictibacillus sp. BK138 TaxID=2512121 RepID=UPI0010D46E1A|nr:hypothetical protein [Fictibacillus sp. BK138]RZT21396.1 hypothetical protein EV282_0458 [Fictibacillus sp. BK138]